MPTGSSLALLCWARDEKRDLLEQVRLALTPKDYLVLGVTGVPGTDVTSAAYSLAFNVRKLTWVTEVIEGSGLRSSHFPSAVTPSTVVGNVTPASASILGLAAGTSVVCGGPDGSVGAAALLGGEVGPVADVAGTTDVVTALTGACDFAPPSGAVLNPFVAPNLWSYGGPTGLTGGAAVWLAGALGYPDLGAALRELGPMMEALPPGCEGLLVVPFLTGSRFPEWDGLERGTLHGLGRQHQPQHLLRAAQEGAAFAARCALEHMVSSQDGGRSGRAILLGGGAAASPAAARLRADVLGAPVLVGEDAEVSARGAAMLAGIGCGVFEDLASAHRAMHPRMAVVAPDPDRARLFEAAYARWGGVRECLRTIRSE
jgi:sugar (pentulose or hexulose) kinase